MSLHKHLEYVTGYLLFIIHRPHRQLFFCHSVAEECAKDILLPNAGALYVVTALSTLNHMKQ